MINAIALDDEPWALQIIETYAKDCDFIALKNSFTSTNNALKYLKKNPVDLIFLDIQMPDINGIEFLKLISQEIMVIFTTAHSKYAVDGFNLNAIDYLLKPIEPERFIQATQKAYDFYIFRKNKINDDKQFIYIRSEYSLIKININDISYIEGMDDYIKIYTNEKYPIITRLTLKSILEKLPPSEFVRIHRSYIVPMQNIKEVRNKKVILDTIELPIGASYETSFMKIF